MMYVIMLAFMLEIGTVCHFFEHLIDCSNIKEFLNFDNASKINFSYTFQLRIFYLKKDKI
jgi:hypothetical protein